MILKKKVYRFKLDILNLETSIRMFMFLFYLLNLFNNKSLFGEDELYRAIPKVRL